jgi:hypothetical protein
MADKDTTHASSTGSTAGSNAATHAGAAHDAGNDRTKPMPAVRNNSGETQGTAPTSLPTSDGSR